jgi:hypothetical protein
VWEKIHNSRGQKCSVLRVRRRVYTNFRGTASGVCVCVCVCVHVCVCERERNRDRDRDKDRERQGLGMSRNRDIRMKTEKSKLTQDELLLHLELICP